MQNKIIISNVDNESMLGDIDSVPAFVFDSTAIISFRLLWLARPGDLVLLPKMPSSSLLKYIESVSKVDFSKVKILVPEQISNRRASLTGSVLLSAEVVSSVTDYLLRCPEASWTLLPYYHTASVGQFGREIGKSLDVRQAPFNAEGGAELLNQKTIFRKFAAGSYVPFAIGEVVEGARALTEAVLNFIPITGTVIIKQDKSGGGEGNYAITSTDERFFKGVSKVLFLSESNLASVVDSVIDELATKGNELLTVEVYYDSSQVLYSEYYLGSDGSVSYLNHGSMRMLPLWSGFEVPGTMKSKAQSDFIHNSTKLASLASSLGYVGHLNIDAIVTTDDMVVFTEINGRTGGCTHVHAVAQHLLGENYLNKKQLTTYNKLIVRSFEDYIDILSENGVSFNPDSGTGVVVLSSDQRDDGVSVELMFIGSDMDEALAIESTSRMLAETIRS